MNATMVLDLWLLQVDPVFIVSIHAIHTLLGLPLNIYIIVLILGGPRKVDAPDLFSLNQAVMEILFMFMGPFHSMCCIDSDMCFIQVFGFFLGMGMCVRPFFQFIVCVERFVAIVHPIVFLRFKALRYHVLVCGVPWVFGLACGAVCMETFPNMPYNIFVIMYLSILIPNTYICVSIMKKLRHPSPGDGGRNKEDRVKKQALHLITINMFSFLMQNVPMMTTFAVKGLLTMRAYFMASSISLIFNIAVSFIQPTLILYKAGKSHL